MSDASPRRPSALALLLAVVAAVLAAGIGGLAAHRSAGTLRSTALVSVDEPKAVAASNDGGVLEKLSRVRLKYLGLIPTDRIAVPVATRLRTPVEQVRGRLSATVVPEDLLLRVTCTGPVAATTRACADALAQALVAYAVQDQVAYDIPLAQRIVLTQVQPAGPASRPRTGRGRTLGISLLAGALAAAAVLALAMRQRR